MDRRHRRPRPRRRTRSGPRCAGSRPRAPPRNRGVRIVTATATGVCPGPAARISIGSSPTSVSGRSTMVDPRTARTWAPDTWRRAGWTASEGSSGAGTPAVYAAAAMTEPILSPDALQFLAAARRATLATIDDLGRPGSCRSASSCRRIGATEVPVDPYGPRREAEAGRRSVASARVHDISLRPTVSLLVDRWSEDWTDLAWLRVHGDAILLEPADRLALDEADGRDRGTPRQVPAVRDARPGRPAAHPDRGDECHLVDRPRRLISGAGSAPTPVGRRQWAEAIAWW